MNLPADEGPAPGAGSTDDEAAGSVPPGGRSAGPTPSTDAEPAGADARRAARRKMLDEVFGDVLPAVTRDELDDGSDRGGSDRDQWYRDNRPPHHS